MLKALFGKKNRSKDFRFVNKESFEVSRSYQSLKSFDRDHDTFIRVEKESSINANANANAPSSFMERIRTATTEMVVEELFLEAPSSNEEIELSLPKQKPSEKNVYGFDFDRVCTKDLKELKGLGVFSDSKIYSALIHSVLSNYHLNIQHFNHPNTFKSENYDCFDNISAWIIFLSDENDSDFLDMFLDRYVEKPTLFLFSKLNKDASIKRINQFIQQHSLNIATSEILLYDVDEQFS